MHKATVEKHGKMSEVSGISFNAELGVLVCRVHGAAVRPGPTSISRHLRSGGHEIRGRTKTKAVDTLAGLPLRSVDDIKRACPPARLQPVSPVPHVTIHSGWSCLGCKGNTLTTNHETIRRHVSEAHSQTAADHSEARPLWERCSLQTLFSSSSDVRYFRVRSGAETTPTATATQQPRNNGRDEGGLPHLDAEEEHHSDDRCDTEVYLTRLRRDRAQYEADAAARANVNPDTDSRETGIELWMSRLGLDRYLAGLHKDEMLAAYEISKPEEGDSHLQELCEISEELLRDTLRSCQSGPLQRMTEPQANRINKFWKGADPEGRAGSFRTKIKSGTVKQYFRHWSEFLTFCWRGWSGELFLNSLEDMRRKAAASACRASSCSSSRDSEETHLRQSTPDSSLNGWDEDSEDVLYKRYFHLSRRQEGCLNDFVTRTFSYEGDSRQRAAALKEAVIAFAQAVVEQHLAKSPFHSPLIAYVAMRAVTRGGNWQEPGSFNSHLSALIYCGQLWVFRFACKRVDLQASVSGMGEGQDLDPDIDDGLDHALDAYMNRFFTNEVSKPFGSLLLWRRRLFGIMKGTMVDRNATWDPETRSVVSFLGRSISMDQVRLLCRKTIERARHTLYNKLMFAVEHLPRLTPKELHETDYERTPGWWFGKHRQNAAILRGHKEALVEHVASMSELRLLWMEEQASAAGQTSLAWRSSSIKLYQEFAQEFLKDLAAAIHFSSGPPVRAPELLSPS